MQRHNRRRISHSSHRRITVKDGGSEESKSLRGPARFSREIDRLLKPLISSQKNAQVMSQKKGRAKAMIIRNLRYYTRLRVESEASTNLRKNEVSKLWVAWWCSNRPCGRHQWGQHHLVSGYQLQGRTMPLRRDGELGCILGEILECKSRSNGKPLTEGEDTGVVNFGLDECSLVEVTVHNTCLRQSSKYRGKEWARTTSHQLRG